MSTTTLLLTTALAVTPAAPPDAPKLFEEGRAALKANDLPRACAAFSRSHQLQPALGVLLNLASCLERQGKLASAWVRFNEAVAWAVRTHEVDREQFAREHASKLKPRLSWLALSAASECAVSIDEAIPLGLSPNAPLSVPQDPGTHRLVATSTGLEPWSTSVTMPREGGSVTVSVPALKSTTPPLVAPSPVAETPPAMSPGPPPPPPLVQAQSRPSAAGGVAMIVAGGVMALAGGIGLGWSFTTYDTLQGQRASLPNPNIRVSRATFDQLSWIHPTSWVVVSVGAVSAIVGVVLTGRGSSETRVMPLVGPGATGLLLSGTF